MRTTLLFIIMFTLIATALTGAAAADDAPARPFVSPVFGSHMVLQRDKTNTIWGWTRPGRTVTVAIADRTASGVADASGRWTVRIDPPPVGGPYALTIDGPQRVELTDVLVGDVWICSGQSNMELGITFDRDAATDVPQANDSNLRLFMAPQQVAMTEKDINGGTWTVCTPETVAKGGWGGFSAVGYHFGRSLRHALNVPIGLVHMNWGGTPAEAWTSAAALQPLGDFAPGLTIVESLSKENLPPYSNHLELWLSQNDAGSQPDRGWEAPELDTRDWQDVNIARGFDALGLESGVAWFRREFDLTPDAANASATLLLGPIHTIDQTWVNGEKVGNSGWGPWPREYGVGPSVFKPGKNVIAVRVIATDPTRGFEASPEEMVLRLADNSTIPLGGTWKARIGALIDAEHPGPLNYATFPNLPSVLFNGMVCPQAPQAICGVIWYQGETNAPRAHQYRTLLPTMIHSWRNAFGQGEFPFYIVSLAAYQPHKDTPGDDEWAEMREAQAFVARTVPHSGLALALDLGDANDIHPNRKKAVGERLALVALRNSFDRGVVASGPVYREMQRDGSTIVLRFDYTDGELKVQGDELGEFAIAGADRQWHWANARIEGDTVIVSSPEVSEPVAVRYAWQSNPAATLYNGAGLPAVPFRTDDWPGVTEGRK